jgi:hypothetical protein
MKIDFKKIEEEMNEDNHDAILRGILSVPVKEKAGVVYLHKYSEDQPRDEGGRFATSDGSASGASSDLFPETIPPALPSMVGGMRIISSNKLD